MNAPAARVVTGSNPLIYNGLHPDSIADVLDSIHDMVHFLSGAVLAESAVSDDSARAAVSKLLIMVNEAVEHVGGLIED